MNRNQQLMAKSEQYAKKLDELLQSVSKLLDNPAFVKALMKADVSGHLHEIRATSGPDALRKYLLAKMKEDPFAFGEQLEILSYQYKLGLTKVTNHKLGEGPGQLGSNRINPNLRASEPGRSIPVEGFGESLTGETQAQKAQRIRAREILVKSECARHCKKTGRPNCLWCNGIGFEARKRLGDFPSNQPHDIVR